ncbi:general odorant-binding protein 69a [Leptinotarsa decemlineata]|uniref:general odorant-binding protein 69a n=1 Tax=Leptinotarsa decemlineata TaxID=7539 RepID=UPI000C254D22|nr:general odorant-binding protein 69a-like [Leptinotarsa decemlineata]
MFPLILVGFLLCGVYGITEEQQQIMDSLHAECTSQTGVSEDLIVNARNGDFSEDNKLKCYMKCIFEELGALEDDGSIDVDGMIAILPDEIKETATPIFTKCGTQAGVDVCDAIFQTHKCYYAGNPQMYFLP